MYRVLAAAAFAAGAAMAAHDMPSEEVVDAFLGEGAGSIGINGFFQCRGLNLDDSFFDTVDTGSDNFVALNKGDAAAFLRSGGVMSITATSPISPGSTILRTADVALLNTANPPSDDDLGAPNRKCGQSAQDMIALGFSPNCWEESKEAGLATPAPLGSETDSFRGGANNLVPFVNCSTESCPGNGCGGGRYEATDGTKNLDSEECEFVSAPRAVIVDGAPATIQCPVYNPTALCVPQGNVMVIQEVGSNLVATGEADDDFRGGTITIVFNRPVSIATLTVVDIDFDIEAGTISYFNSADALVRTENLIDPGNNGFESAFIPGDLEDIKRVEVFFSGSGSINDLQWCVPGGNVTTTPTIRRTCEWDITKDVVPDSVSGLVGSSSDVEYTVTGTRECVDTYEVCAVMNAGSPSPVRAARVVGIEYGIDSSAIQTNEFEFSRDVNISEDCQCRDSLDGDFAPCVFEADGAVVLNPSCTLGQCEIRCEKCIDAPDNRDYFSAFAFTTDPSNDLAGNFRVVGQALFGDEPTETIDTEATIEDSDGLFDTYVASDSFVETYPRTLDCDEPGTSFYNCTSSATGVDTGTRVEDDASVLQECVAPTIAIDPAASYRRCYDWMINKTGSSPDETATSIPDTTEIFFNDALSAATVTYTTEVKATPREDRFTVNGTVTIANPHPTDDMTAALINVNYDAGACNVVCPGATPADLFSGILVAASTSITCDFSCPTATRPADTDEIFASMSVLGVAYSSGAEAVSFSAVTPEFCNNVGVVTDFYEPDNSTTDLGTYTATSASPETFQAPEGTKTFEALPCEDGQVGEIVENYDCVATVTYDEGSASDPWNVITRSLCATDCPCDYQDYPADTDPEEEVCYEAHGDHTGICLCFTG